jgi:SAM-dependent methyltransferase/uncharacterized protein YbaR (Trm112 family)
MRDETLDLLRCPLTGTRLDVDERARTGDDLTFALLRSEGGTFPVIGGIPVFTSGREPLVDLVERGEHDLAVRRAAFGGIPPSGWLRAGPWLTPTERLRGVGRRLEARWTGELDRRARPLTDPATPTRDLFALAYREVGLRNPEVFAYNWFRFGVPRHLAALAAIEWAPPVGPVLDLGCGAGHLTWALARHVSPATVIGVDSLFFALYVARHRIARESEFICCDFESLPLRDEVVRGLWASDVVHALARKAQIRREIDRVTASPGWGAVVDLFVAGHAHEYAGRPLSLDGYRDLLPAAATFVADDALIGAYLDGRAANRSTPGAVTEAATVTALWADDGLEAADGRGFDGWPHARGRLGPNPLFAVDAQRGAVTALRLQMPTPAYEAEHGGLRRFTPDRVEVPDAAVEAAVNGTADPDLHRLIEQFVVLGFPDAYLDDPWAGFGPDG